MALNEKNYNSNKPRPSISRVHSIEVDYIERGQLTKRKCSTILDAYTEMTSKLWHANYQVSGALFMSFPLSSDELRNILHWSNLFNKVHFLAGGRKKTSGLYPEPLEEFKIQAKSPKGAY